MSINLIPINRSDGGFGAPFVGGGRAYESGPNSNMDTEGVWRKEYGGNGTCDDDVSAIPTIAVANIAVDAVPVVKELPPLTLIASSSANRALEVSLRTHRNPYSTVEGAAAKQRKSMVLTAAASSGGQQKTVVGMDATGASGGLAAGSGSAIGGGKRLSVVIGVGAASAPSKVSALRTDRVLPSRYYGRHVGSTTRALPPSFAPPRARVFSPELVEKILAELAPEMAEVPPRVDCWNCRSSARDLSRRSHVSRVARGKMISYSHVRATQGLQEFLRLKREQYGGYSASVAQRRSSYSFTHPTSMAQQQAEVLPTFMVKVAKPSLDGGQQDLPFSQHTPPSVAASSDSPLSIRGGGGGNVSVHAVVDGSSGSISPLIGSMMGGGGRSSHNHMMINAIRSPRSALKGSPNSRRASIALSFTNNNNTNSMYNNGAIRRPSVNFDDTPIVIEGDEDGGAGGPIPSPLSSPNRARQRHMYVPSPSYGLAAVTAGGAHRTTGMIPTLFIKFEGDDVPFMALDYSVHPLDNAHDLRRLIIQKMRSTMAGGEHLASIRFDYTSHRSVAVKLLSSLQHVYETFYDEGDFLMAVHSDAREVKALTRLHRQQARMLEAHTTRLRTTVERNITVDSLLPTIKMPAIVKRNGPPAASFFYPYVPLPPALPSRYLRMSLEAVCTVVKPLCKPIVAELNRQAAELADAALNERFYNSQRLQSSMSVSLPSGASPHRHIPKAAAPPADCGIAPLRPSLKLAALEVLRRIRWARAMRMHNATVSFIQQNNANIFCSPLPREIKRMDGTVIKLDTSATDAREKKMGYTHKLVTRMAKPDVMRVPIITISRPNMGLFSFSKTSSALAAAAASVDDGKAALALGKAYSVAETVTFNLNTLGAEQRARQATKITAASGPLWQALGFNIDGSGGAGGGARKRAGTTVKFDPLAARRKSLMGLDGVEAGGGVREGAPANNNNATFTSILTLGGGAGNGNGGSSSSNYTSSAQPLAIVRDDNPPVNYARLEQDLDAEDIRSSKSKKSQQKSITTTTTTTDTATHYQSALSLSRLHKLTPANNYVSGNNSLLLVGDEGVPLSWRDTNGMSLLHYAVLREDPKLIRILCENNIDVCCAASDGRTAAHLILTRRISSEKKMNLLEAILNHASPLSLREMFDVRDGHHSTSSVSHPTLTLGSSSSAGSVGRIAGSPRNPPPTHRSLQFEPASLPAAVVRPRETGRTVLEVALMYCDFSIVKRLYEALEQHKGGAGPSLRERRAISAYLSLEDAITRCDLDVIKWHFDVYKTPLTTLVGGGAVGGSGASSELSAGAVPVLSFALQLHPLYMSEQLRLNRSNNARSVLDDSLPFDRRSPLVPGKGRRDSSASQATTAQGGDGAIRGGDPLTGGLGGRRRSASYSGGSNNTSILQPQQQQQQINSASSLGTSIQGVLASVATSALPAVVTRPPSSASCPSPLSKRNDNGGALLGFGAGPRTPLSTLSGKATPHTRGTPAPGTLTDLPSAEAYREMMMWLILRGMPPTLCDEHGRNSFHYAARCGASLWIIHMLKALKSAYANGLVERDIYADGIVSATNPQPSGSPLASQTTAASSDNKAFSTAIGSGGGVDAGDLIALGKQVLAVDRNNQTFIHTLLQWYRGAYARGSSAFASTASPAPSPSRGGAEGYTNSGLHGLDTTSTFNRSSPFDSTTTATNVTSVGASPLVQAGDPFTQERLESELLPVLHHSMIAPNLDYSIVDSTYGNSLLHWACYSRSAAVLSFFARPLHYDTSEVVRSIATQRNKEGDTPLTAAIKANFSRGISILMGRSIAAEALISGMGCGDRTPFLLAVDCFASQSAFGGSHIGLMDERPHCATRKENHCVDILIKSVQTHEGTIDLRRLLDAPSGPRRETPLHSAVRNRLWHMAALLLTHHASCCSVRDGEGLTALELACRDPDDAHLARLLLSNDRSAIESGASVTSCVSFGGAVAYKTDLLEEFFFSRVVFDLRGTVLGDTMLRAAARTGNLKLLRFALERGAREVRTVSPTSRGEELRGAAGRSYESQERASEEDDKKSPILAVFLRTLRLAYTDGRTRVELAKKSSLVRHFTTREGKVEALSLALLMVGLGFAVGPTVLCDAIVCNMPALVVEILRLPVCNTSTTSRMESSNQHEGSNTFTLASFLDYKDLERGDTPLHLACRKATSDGEEFAIRLPPPQFAEDKRESNRRKAPKKKVAASSSSFLHDDAVQHNWNAIVFGLCERSSMTNALNNSNETPLTIAIHNNNPLVAVRLILSGHHFAAKLSAVQRRKLLSFVLRPYANDFLESKCQLSLRRTSLLSSAWLRDRIGWKRSAILADAVCSARMDIVGLFLQASHRTQRHSFAELLMAPFDPTDEMRGRERTSGSGTKSNNKTGDTPFVSNSDGAARPPKLDCVLTYAAAHAPAICFEMLLGAVADAAKKKRPVRKINNEGGTRKPPLFLQYGAVRAALMNAIVNGRMSNAEALLSTLAGMRKPSTQKKKSVRKHVKDPEQTQEDGATESFEDDSFDVYCAHPTLLHALVHTPFKTRRLFKLFISILSSDVDASAQHKWLLQMLVMRKEQETYTAALRRRTEAHTNTNNSITQQHQHHGGAAYLSHNFGQQMTSMNASFGGSGRHAAVSNAKAAASESAAAHSTAPRLHSSSGGVGAGGGGGRVGIGASIGGEAAAASCLWMMVGPSVADPHLANEVRPWLSGGSGGKSAPSPSPSAGGQLYAEHQGTSTPSASASPPPPRKRRGTLAGTEGALSIGLLDGTCSDTNAEAPSEDPTPAAPSDTTAPPRLVIVTDKQTMTAPTPSISSSVSGGGKEGGTHSSQQHDTSVADVTISFHHSRQRTGSFRGAAGREEEDDLNLPPHTTTSELRMDSMTAPSVSKVGGGAVTGSAAVVPSEADRSSSHYASSIAPPYVTTYPSEHAASVLVALLANPTRFEMPADPDDWDAPEGGEDISDLIPFEELAAAAGEGMSPNLSSHHPEGIESANEHAADDHRSSSSLDFANNKAVARDAEEDGDGDEESKAIRLLEEEGGVIGGMGLYPTLIETRYLKEYLVGVGISYTSTPLAVLARRNLLNNHHHYGGGRGGVKRYYYYSSNGGGDATNLQMQQQQPVTPRPASFSPRGGGRASSTDGGDAMVGVGYEVNSLRAPSSVRVALAAALTRKKSNHPSGDSSVVFGGGAAGDYVPPRAGDFYQIHYEDHRHLLRWDSTSAGGRADEEVDSSDNGSDAAEVVPIPGPGGAPLARLISDLMLRILLQVDLYDSFEDLYPTSDDSEDEAQDTLLHPTDFFTEKSRNEKKKQQQALTTTRGGGGGAKGKFGDKSEDDEAAAAIAGEGEDPLANTASRVTKTARFQVPEDEDDYDDDDEREEDEKEEDEKDGTVVATGADGLNDDGLSLNADHFDANANSNMDLSKANNNNNKSLTASKNSNAFGGGGGGDKINTSTMFRATGSFAVKKQQKSTREQGPVAEDMEGGDLVAQPTILLNAIDDEDADADEDQQLQGVVLSGPQGGRQVKVTPNHQMLSLNHTQSSSMAGHHHHHDEGVMTAMLAGGVAPPTARSSNANQPQPSTDLNSSRRGIYVGDAEAVPTALLFGGASARRRRIISRVLSSPYNGHGGAYYVSSPFSSTSPRIYNPFVECLPIEALEPIFAHKLSHTVNHIAAHLSSFPKIVGRLSQHVFPDGRRFLDLSMDVPVPNTVIKKVIDSAREEVLSWRAHGSWWVETLLDVRHPDLIRRIPAPTRTQYPTLSLFRDMARSDPTTQKNLSEAYDENTPLHRAIVRGRSKITAHILQSTCVEVDVNVKNRKGRTALMLSAITNRNECASQLVSTGVDVMVEDVDGMTALHHAAASGSAPIVELILADDDGSEAACNVSTKPFASYPIVQALKNGKDDCAFELLSSFASERAPKEITLAGTGETLLHFAAMTNCTITMEALLSHSSPRHLRALTVDGLSCRDYTPVGSSMDLLLRNAGVRRHAPLRDPRPVTIQDIANHRNFVGYALRDVKCEEGRLLITGAGVSRALEATENEEGVYDAEDLPPVHNHHHQHHHQGLFNQQGHASGGDTARRPSSNATSEYNYNGNTKELQRRGSSSTYRTVGGGGGGGGRNAASMPHQQQNTFGSGNAAKQSLLLPSRKEVYASTVFIHTANSIASTAGGGAASAALVVGGGPSGLGNSPNKGVTNSSSSGPEGGASSALSSPSPALTIAAALQTYVSQISSVDELAYKAAAEGDDDELLGLLRLGATDGVRLRIYNIPPPSQLLSDRDRAAFAREVVTALAPLGGITGSVMLPPPSEISKLAALAEEDEEEARAIRERGRGVSVGGGPGGIGSPQSIYGGSYYGQQPAAGAVGGYPYHNSSHAPSSFIGTSVAELRHQHAPAGSFASVAASNTSFIAPMGMAAGTAPSAGTVSFNINYHGLVLMSEDQQADLLLQRNNIVVRRGTPLYFVRDTPKGSSYRTSVKQGQTGLLHLICKNNCAKSLQYVLEANSQLGIASKRILELLSAHYDEAGFTPYHYAVLCESWPCLAIILKAQVPQRPGRRLAVGPPLTCFSSHTAMHDAALVIPSTLWSTAKGRVTDWFDIRLSERPEDAITFMTGTTTGTPFATSGAGSSTSRSKSNSKINNLEFTVAPSTLFLPTAHALFTTASFVPSSSTVPAAASTRAQKAHPSSSLMSARFREQEGDNNITNGNSLFLRSVSNTGRMASSSALGLGGSSMTVAGGGASATTSTSGALFLRVANAGASTAVESYASSAVAMPLPMGGTATYPRGGGESRNSSSGTTTHSLVGPATLLASSSYNDGVGSSSSKRSSHGSALLVGRNYSVHSVPFGGAGATATTMLMSATRNARPTAQSPPSPFSHSSLTQSTLELLPPPAVMTADSEVLIGSRCSIYHDAGALFYARRAGDRRTTRHIITAGLEKVIEVNTEALRLRLMNELFPFEKEQEGERAKKKDEEALSRSQGKEVVPNNNHNNNANKRKKSNNSENRALEESEEGNGDSSSALGSEPVAAVFQQHQQDSAEETASNRGALDPRRTTVTSLSDRLGQLNPSASELLDSVQQSVKTLVINLDADEFDARDSSIERELFKMAAMFHLGGGVLYRLLHDLYDRFVFSAASPPLPHGYGADISSEGDKGGNGTNVSGGRIGGAGFGPGVYGWLCASKLAEVTFVPTRSEEEARSRPILIRRKNPSLAKTLKENVIAQRRRGSHGEGAAKKGAEAAAVAAAAERSNSDSDYEIVEEHAVNGPRLQKKNRKLSTDESNKLTDGFGTLHVIVPIYVTRKEIICKSITTAFEDYFSTAAVGLAVDIFHEVAQIRLKIGTENVDLFVCDRFCAIVHRLAMALAARRYVCERAEDAVDFADSIAAELQSAVAKTSGLTVRDVDHRLGTVLSALRYIRKFVLANAPLTAAPSSAAANYAANQKQPPSSAIASSPPPSPYQTVYNNGGKNPNQHPQRRHSAGYSSSSSAKRCTTRDKLGRRGSLSVADDHGRKPCGAGYFVQLGQGPLVHVVSPKRTSLKIVFTFAAMKREVFDSQSLVGVGQGWEGAGPPRRVKVDKQYESQSAVTPYKLASLVLGCSLDNVGGLSGISQVTAEGMSYLPVPINQHNPFGHTLAKNNSNLTAAVPASPIPASQQPYISSPTTLGPVGGGTPAATPRPEAHGFLGWATKDEKGLLSLVSPGNAPLSFSSAGHAQRQQQGALHNNSNSSTTTPRASTAGEGASLATLPSATVGPSYSSAITKDRIGAFCGTSFPIKRYAQLYQWHGGGLFAASEQQQQQSVAPTSTTDLPSPFETLFKTVEAPVLALSKHRGERLAVPTLSSLPPELTDHPTIIAAAEAKRLLSNLLPTASSTLRQKTATYSSLQGHQPQGSRQDRNFSIAIEGVEIFAAGGGGGGGPQSVQHSQHQQLSFKENDKDTNDGDTNGDKARNTHREVGGNRNIDHHDDHEKAEHPDHLQAGGDTEKKDEATLVPQWATAIERLSSDLLPLVPDYMRYLPPDAAHYPRTLSSDDDIKRDEREAQQHSDNGGSRVGSASAAGGISPSSESTRQRRRQSSVKGLGLRSTPSLFFGTIPRTVSIAANYNNSNKTDNMGGTKEDNKDDFEEVVGGLAGASEAMKAALSAPNVLVGLTHSGPSMLLGPNSNNNNSSLHMSSAALSRGGGQHYTSTSSSSYLSKPSESMRVGSATTTAGNVAFVAHRGSSIGTGGAGVPMLAANGRSGNQVKDYSCFSCSSSLFTGPYTNTVPAVVWQFFVLAIFDITHDIGLLLGPMARVCKAWRSAVLCCLRDGLFVSVVHDWLEVAVLSSRVLLARARAVAERRESYGWSVVPVGARESVREWLCVDGLRSNRKVRGGEKKWGLLSQGNKNDTSGLTSDAAYCSDVDEAYTLFLADPHAVFVWCTSIVGIDAVASRPDLPVHKHSLRVYYQRAEERASAIMTAAPTTRIINGVQVHVGRPASSSASTVILSRLGSASGRRPNSTASLHRNKGRIAEARQANSMAAAVASIRSAANANSFVEAAASSSTTVTAQRLEDLRQHTKELHIVAIIRKIFEVEKAAALLRASLERLRWRMTEAPLVTDYASLLLKHQQEQDELLRLQQEEEERRLQHQQQMQQRQQQQQLTPMLGVYSSSAQGGGRSSSQLLAASTNQQQYLFPRSSSSAALARGGSLSVSSRGSSTGAHGGGFGGASSTTSYYVTPAITQTESGAHTTSNEVSSPHHYLVSEETMSFSAERSRGN